DQVGGGTPGPGDGECDKRHEQCELARTGEAGVLDVEAAGFGVTEHGFDGPAFAIAGQPPPRGEIGDDDQPFIAKALGGKVEERCVLGRGVLAGAEARLKETGAPGAAKPGSEGKIAAVL